MTAPMSTAPSPRRSLGRVAARATVALVVAMWGYVLYLAVGPGRQPPPDRLDDPAFAIEAERTCGEALDFVAALPNAIEAGSATERAEILTRANARFSTMLDELAAVTPDGDDGRIVREWLADWRTYLGDRSVYAEALREDPEARLLVTAKDRQQITEYIDAFAADNRMPACATPIDV